MARKNAAAALRKDDRFQELMRDSMVREAVDAVIEKPENVVRVASSIRSKEVMYCLSKLKQLRDINRQHEGGAMNLTELLTSWSPDEEEKSRGVLLKNPDCVLSLSLPHLH
jgi:hypothetical protein